MSLETVQPNSVTSFSHVLVKLMKGVTYRDDDANIWESLLKSQARVREHLALIGLELILDEPEGYAYLRQRQQAQGEPELPRLIPRRQLSYPVSLLLALIRKKLAESDSRSGDTRLILSREQIAELVRVFLPATANEARLIDRLDADIKRIVEMGFLRRLRGQEEQFEVRRILKAFVDAQWLNEFERRLAEYRDPLSGERDQEAIE